MGKQDLRLPKGVKAPIQEVHDKRTCVPLVRPVHLDLLECNALTGIRELIGESTTPNHQSIKADEQKGADSSKSASETRPIIPAGKCPCADDLCAPVSNIIEATGANIEVREVDIL